MHLSSPVAGAAAPSQVVVLLLLIYRLMYFSFFVGVLRLSFFCALLCAVSIFASILNMYVGWYAVCDGGIS